MSDHFDKELESLRQMLVDLASQVLQSLLDAVKALKVGDLMLAESVIGRDARIDRAEINVEKKCQHILTLDQPVAGDLRYVMSVLKINMNLERMADQAAHIATQVTYLLSCTPSCQPLPDELQNQSGLVIQMVRDGLDALADSDVDRARKVMAADDDVDRIHRGMHARVAEAITTNPGRVEEMICHLKISQELERIADHAVNICEDVLFIAEGRIARHMGDASDDRVVNSS